MSEENNDGKRKRGVQASPVKLRKALVDAGIKTQSELAEKIADIEGLENAPRGLVNKVFRGQAVDQLSLERVARALEIESWKLYLDSEEIGGADKIIIPEDINETIQVSNDIFVYKKWVWAIAACFLIFGVASFYLVTTNNSKYDDFTHPSPFAIWQGLNPTFDKYSLVVAPETSVSLALAETLNSHLEKHFSVAVESGLGLMVNKKPYELEQQFDTDLVLTLKRHESGRHIGLVFYLYADGQEQLVWAEHQTESALEKNSGYISERVETALLHALGIKGQADGLSFPPDKALWEFIHGLNYLDESYTGLETKQAQAHLHAAIRQYPNYPEANGALCEALANESWQGDVIEELIEAQLFCDKALSLKPNNLEIKNRNAWILLAMGKANEAIELFKKNYEMYPEDEETLRQLGQAEMLYYPQIGDDSILEAAKLHSEKSIKINPNFWKPYHTLAFVEFYRQNIPRAIQYLEMVIDREPYVPALTSVANLYLCEGQFAESEKKFKQLINEKPGLYIGYEMLGTYYYLIGKPDEAIINLDKATKNVEKNANQSAMWSVLADAYYLNGDFENAAINYEKAIQIMQNDKLLGVETLGQKVVFENTINRLKKMYPERYDHLIASELDLDELSNSITSLAESMAVARAYVTQGNNLAARELYLSNVESCEVYRYHPELKFLLDADQMTSAE